MRNHVLFCALLLILLVPACRQEPADVSLAPAATGAPQSPTARPPAPTVAPTSTPAPTQTPAPSPTSLPSLTVAPMETPTTTPTPEPEARVKVVSARDARQVLSGATVRALSSDGALALVTDESGQVRFGPVAAGDTYTLTVGASGYVTTTTFLSGTALIETAEIALEPVLTGAVAGPSANLRAGPGTAYETVAALSGETVLTVQGRNEEGTWLAVTTIDGQTGWMAASVVSLDWEPDALAVVPGPPPPPAVAAAPTAAAPPAGSPVGPNLLVNSGFEDGIAAWTSNIVTWVQAGWHGSAWWTPAGYSFPRNHSNIISRSVYPQFVRSGEMAAFQPFSAVTFQFVSGVTPGTRYRFSAWARLWSSDTDDRTVSQNPGQIQMYVCISPGSQQNPWGPDTSCSLPGSPVDNWAYFSIEAEAIADQLSVILVSMVVERSLFHEMTWDDALLVALQ